MRGGRGELLGYFSAGRADARPRPSGVLPDEGILRLFLGGIPSNAILRGDGQGKKIRRRAQPPLAGGVPPVPRGRKIRQFFAQGAAAFGEVG